MIKTCTKCGGLYSDTSLESFAGTPCSCVRPSQYAFTVTEPLSLTAAGAQEWFAAPATPVAQPADSVECLGCIASRAGVGRCLVHETKPSTTTPATAAVEAARAIKEAYTMFPKGQWRTVMAEEIAAIISKYLPAQQPDGFYWRGRYEKARADAIGECIEAARSVIAGWRSDLDESWDERPDLSFEAADKITGANEVIAALEQLKGEGSGGGRDE